MKRLTRCALLGGVLAGLALSGQACAGASDNSTVFADAGAGSATLKLFDISALPADKALNEFARQADINLVYSSDAVAKTQANPLKGRYTLRNAIAILLEGTELDFQQLNDKTIAISRRAAEKTTTTSNVSSGILTLAQANSVAAPDSSAGAGSDSADEGTLQEIVVTGTQIKGLKQVPTPVTTLDAVDLRVGGNTDLGSVLADLPSSFATISPTTTTTRATRAGASNANLRGLGEFRTLVLVDGHRLVSQDGTGTVDLNSIPLGLVDRIETVTGGASAAYGSDAVSGVVNIIMSKKKQGLNLSAQYGDTTQRSVDLGDEYKIDMSYGVGFNQDRGHVIVGGNHNVMARIGPQTLNPAFRWGTIANPAFNATTNPNVPRQLLRQDIFSASTSLGGLITGCAVNGVARPASDSCGGLKNLTFESNGTTRPFVLGQMVVGSGAQATMVGGDIQATNAANYINLRAPVTRDNAYGRVSYDVSDNLAVNLDAYFAHSDGESGFIPSSNGQGPQAAFAINVNNAFLPASVKTSMQNAGLTTINLGRISPDWGQPTDHVTNTNAQATLGLQGKFGDGWMWDSFYSYGKVRLNVNLSNNPLKALLSNAVDSVLVNGQPQCRSVATNPNCVPLNVFGPGVASQAALDYFMGTSSLHSELVQQEASLILRGTPFSTWAGPVLLATGAEWRLISLTQVGDALSATNSFAGLNFQGVNGGDRVGEEFLETDIPLAKDLPLLNELRLNGAVRSSDYRLSGRVTSWKFGMTDKLMDGLLLRFTRSRDIRAPNVQELFTAGSTLTGPVFDPVTNTNPVVQTVSGGNPALVPEQATSNTFGFVYQPSWAHGLSMSVDVFNIDISSAITQLQGQTVINGCVNGNASLCSAITRDPQQGNRISGIVGRFANLAGQTEKGADFEISHSANLAALSPALYGRLSSRALFTYVKEQNSFDGVTTTEGAGVGIPYLRGILDERYELGRWSSNLRARYVSGLVRSRVNPLDDNYIPHQLYLDAGFEFRSAAFGGELALYGNILNLQDRPTPALANAAVHDVIGRRFNVGLRLSL